MRYWILLLLPALAIGQIHAKVGVIGRSITEYKSSGKLVSITKQDKGKDVVKLTCLDAEFTTLVTGREVDIHKSVSVAVLDAKKLNKLIELVDSKGNKKKYDLSKENERSVLASLEADVKAGYTVDNKIGKVE